MGYKDKNCLHCGIEFTPLSSKSLYCSRKHMYIEKRKRLLKWREDNPEEHIKRSKKYVYNAKIKQQNIHNNVLCFKKYNCLICNKEYTPLHTNQRYCCKKCKFTAENILKKQRRKINPTPFRINDKKFYHSSPEYRKNRLINIKQRRLNNPNERIACSLRGRLRTAIKSKENKKYSVLKLIGCSLDFLREHLEKQFKPGMSWDNYGLYGWHIDHFRPCASYDLTKIEEQKKCFHYTNLQPLWAQENLSKGSKIIGVDIC